MAAFKANQIEEYEAPESDHLELKSTHQHIDLSAFNFSVATTYVMRAAISRLCPTEIAEMDIADIVDMAIQEQRKTCPTYEPSYRELTHEEVCDINQKAFGEMPKREDWRKHLRRVKAERPDLFGRIMNAELGSAKRAENKRILEIQTRIATGSGKPPANAGRSHFETSQE